MARKKTTALIAGGVVAVTAAGVAGILTAERDLSGTAEGFAAGHSELSFEVDPGLSPSVAAVDPLDGRAEQRPVGVLAGPDGLTAELVLDEVIVHVSDQAELGAFLDRWGGQVLDSFPADADGQDHLVRVDAGRANATSLPKDLLAVEPDQSGTYSASDERAIQLLALAAAEWRAGTELVIDWLTDPVSIEDGEVYESSDITEGGAPKNVFRWSFMRTGGAMDTGVAAAWQLLHERGKLERRVRYMVLDGGFSPNFDFPDNSKIRKGKWGKKNPKDCTNGTPCPYHGTDVVLAGMGQVGNEYGTAGPAGPVVSQLIAVGNSLDYWSKLRRLESMAEEERPDVVNLSFTRDVYVGGKYAKTWTDRRMRHVQATGALIVAAAGNNGRNVHGDTLWVPCESTYVMCVGGMDSSAALATGSNYGTGDSSTSVEIYGPMCVRSINDPNRSALDYTTRQVCGTSVASPFVGGVAALVMAADPDLGPEDVRGILNDTANVGGLGSKVTGSQRRVNALQAVARALGVEVANPVVTIEAPASGDTFGVEEWVDLRGSATDFMGRPLPIQWVSDVDGDLASESKTSVLPLSLGTHVITATITDSTGRTGSAQVTIEVIDTPPQVAIVSPPEGFEVLEGSDVALVATSVDPDTWSPVPGSETEWEVRRNGSLVYSASGHKATLPGSTVSPGDYTVRFTAAGTTAERPFTVAAIPPGETQPVATIIEPGTGQTLHAYNGNPQTIVFAGTGSDAEDGTIAGMRFRWVADSANETTVLCEGSNVPQDQDTAGGLVAPKSCASFSAQLGLASGDVGWTTWTVRLEVFDSSGLTATDSIDITIQYVTG